MAGCDPNGLRRGASRPRAAAGRSPLPGGVQARLPVGDRGGARVDMDRGAAVQADLGGGGAAGQCDAELGDFPAPVALAARPAGRGGGDRGVRGVAGRQRDRGGRPARRDRGEGGLPVAAETQQG